jgi:hypothetical protein
MHRWYHDMARIFLVELLDPLAEVGLDHLDSDGGHVLTEAAFLSQHRFALDQRFHPVVAENAMNNPVVFCRIARPVHVNAVRPCPSLELIEIVVEVG